MFKSLSISFLLLCLLTTQLNSQVLTNTILGDTENNQLGFHLKTTEDGSRFAYTSREFINDSIYHDVVNIFENDNGIVAQVGSPINCSLNFEDTLVSRWIKFDMSDNGERLVILADSIFFYYTLEDEHWELKDQIAFTLREKEFVRRFTFSGDGNTLCILKHNISPNYFEHRVYTYENINDIWTESSLDYIKNYDSLGDIALSFDGNTLALNERISSGNLLFHKVKVFNRSLTEWIPKGEDIEIFGSFYFNFWRDLISLRFSKSTNRLLISGIGEEEDSWMNNVYVQMFEFENDNWTPKGNPIWGYHPQDGFGFSTNFSDDGNRFAISAIGAEFDDQKNNGIVKVYDYVEPDWILKQDTIVGENVWDICGYSTALSGDGTKLFVSCPYYSEDYHRAGKIGIYELSPYTSTTNTLKSDPKFNISPNPTSGFIQINEVSGKALTVYNQVGVPVLSVDLKGASKTLELNLSHLQNGIYFVRVDEGEAQKIVLLRD